METGVFFEAAHLRKLINEGRWGTASRYLRWFPALWKEQGAAAQFASLRASLDRHSELASLACRGEEGGGRDAALCDPEMAQRMDMYRSMTCGSPPLFVWFHPDDEICVCRASANSEEIKLKALQKVQELIDLRPDLEHMLSNPSLQHVPTPQGIIPLGLRGRRKHLRKKIGRKSARDLAYFILHKRLPSSQKISHSGKEGGAAAG